MAVGPVDVYIIGFPGNKFTGQIAPAILELVENGTIRVLDLLFVSGVLTTRHTPGDGRGGSRDDGGASCHTYKSHVVPFDLEGRG